MIRNGVIRGFASSGFTFIAELTLASGRRADLIGLNDKGEIAIIEIKSSIEDYNADSKWPDYLDHCDQFYFATHPEVPESIFPEAHGLIVADHYGCEILRPAMVEKLAAPRRKAVTLRFARAAARQLVRIGMHEAAPGQPITDTIAVED